MKKLNLIALFLGIFLVGGFLFTRFDLKRDLKNLEFSEVSVSKIPDGTYLGKSSIGPVTAEVEVNIQNGEIDTIKLLRHRNSMGESAEALTWIMERMETWDVDCVTGATISSQAIRQAVNRALCAGLQPFKSI